MLLSLPLPSLRRLGVWSLGGKVLVCRGFSASSRFSQSRAMTKGLVLGIYAKEKDDDTLQFTSAGDKFDELVSGKLRELLALCGPPLKTGKTRVFYGLHQDFPSVVVTGLGKKTSGIDELENWNEGKENIRVAVAAACRQIQDLEISSVEVDPCGDAQAAAEGAILGLYEFDELKQKKKTVVSAQLYGSDGDEAWQKGVVFANGQNLARHLMETPANEMTPTRFAEIIEQKLKSVSNNATVHVRNKSWIEDQGMGAFLSVAKGSDEPPVFLEIHYMGSPNADDSPLVFVGKGITFDSGGISIKPAANMDLMRADMGGAATICSTIITAATLKLPLNLIGAMDIALGSGATGVFTNSTWLWTKLLEASTETGDRMWRMPLFEHYTRQIVDCQLADINNIGKYRSGGACTAAAFLKEFVTHSKWAHLDIAGVMANKDEIPYLKKGMSGRPTRTLTEFLVQMSKDKENSE
ncbi:cytosol aminopeptidase isoform X2 [Petaurus breviceps papuanus]|uniref:cytosol aminopeptidase isoform X2 n=1 Tax=Petaurus breviceps papuanus TaxID=3040969 RepID=UPI0036DD4095